MSYNVGSVNGVINLNYNGRGVAQAQAGLAGLQSSSMTTGAAVAATGAAAGKMGLVIAAGLGAGVAAAANFEQRLSAIEAVSGATGAEMDRLRGKALQLGKDTSFSASESAQAMEELVKAGLTVDDVLNGAADAVVALAAAGEIDMPTAATIASNAMNQFNLKAEDMVGVVDNIAGAANASAIDVTDFGMSLSQVGAVANLAGVNFSDTATAIALMGNAGIKGSDAGTSLKSMLSRLQPTTEKQKETMKELGIITEEAGNTFYDAQGNLKGLDQVAGILNKSLEGMSKQQKQAALQTLFGSDAIRAAAILSDKGAKGFDKMAASMGKVTAAEVAATRLDNFKGSIEAMMGSLETLAIAMGTVLLPALRKIVDALAAAFNWFNNLSEGQQRLITIVLVSVATILLLVAAVVKIVAMVKTVIATLTVLRTALATTWVAALGPIALVIAAIVAIGIALVILWKKSETFRTIVTNVWNAIKTFIVAAVNVIVNAVNTGLARARAIWGAVWGTFGPLVRAVWNLIVAIVRLAWTIIKGVVLIGVAAVKAAVTAGWNALKAVTQAVWSAINKAVGDKIAAMMQIVGSIVDKVKGFFSGAGSWLYNAGREIIQGLIDGISSMINAVADKINSVTSKISKFLPGSPVQEGPLKILNRGHAGKQIVGMVIDGLESMARPLADAMGSTLALAAPAGYAAPAAGSAPKPRKRGGGGRRRRERLVDGELRLDPSGRAFIRGVAVEADDDGSDFDDLIGRMR